MGLNYWFTILAKALIYYFNSKILIWHEYVDSKTPPEKYPQIRYF
jgi:hypothetical protein